MVEQQADANGPALWAESLRTQVAQAEQRNAVVSLSVATVRRLIELLDAAAEDAKVAEVAHNFIVKQRITCAETIYQMDRIAEEAPEFIEDICEAAGYHEAD